MLAGEDSTARAGLPVNELLAPLPLLALVVLVGNDWLLKGTAAPEWLTGKLSDFAGLFAFPLLATAVGDLVLYAAARLGAPIDFTLRRWKLATAIALTGIVFAAMKLSPVVGGFVEHAWSSLVGGSSIYPDPTDVVALVVLPATWLVGRRVIARGAYGRLWLVKHRALAAPFGDAARCGADPALVRELEAAIEAWRAGGPAAPVDAALARLRRY
jgi:hypothetical protein